MRLWHKDLIPVLPRKQLLSTWRECVAIAKAIKENGTPNHILVNKVIDYPLSHFYSYAITVAEEMRGRGYTCNFEKFSIYIDADYISYPEIFKNWHNERYLTQCFYNLQEKADNNGISPDEWEIITAAFPQFTDCR